jgi:hypothetical protein
VRYLAVYSDRSRVIDADSPQAAALHAARSMPSVAGLRKGAIISIYPADFLIDVKVQYERPNAEMIPGTDERVGDYGDAVIVDEFKPCDETFSIFR